MTLTMIQIEPLVPNSHWEGMALEVWLVLPGFIGEIGHFSEPSAGSYGIKWDL